MEAWTTFRYLKAQGLGTRRIAGEVGVARNTVRRAIRSDNPPSYKKPPYLNPKLEPFRECIHRMLVNDHFIGIRIRKEIRLRGYDGSHQRSEALVDIQCMKIANHIEIQDKSSRMTDVCTMPVGISAQVISARQICILDT